MAKNSKIFFFLAGIVFLTMVAACSQAKEKKATSESEVAFLFTTTLDQSKLVKAEQLQGCISCEGDVTIAVNASETFQEMDGFGFTLNGGSAMLLQKMSTPGRIGLLRELFGTDTGSIGVS